jgi:hypothetical protein
MTANLPRHERFYSIADTIRSKQKPDILSHLFLCLTQDRQSVTNPFVILVE